MTLQVHDELVFEVPAERDEKRLAQDDGMRVL
jgi:DNA polymerase I-like protein with 3'-5' exonuclease and polymerase domains